MKIVIILSYVIFDQQFKLLSENFQSPPGKSPFPLFYLLTTFKFQKVQALSFLPTLKIFQVSPAERGGRTLNNSSKNK